MTARGSAGMRDRSNNRLRACVDMDVLDDNPLLSTTAKPNRHLHRKLSLFCDVSKTVFVETTIPHLSHQGF